MSHTTDESDQGGLSGNQTGLSLTDEENCSGEIMGWGADLKKGPWTSAEDAFLVDYVKKFGEGNWNAVQKHSGLSRCGKSCRLRWANHLRPNLKKGSFTDDEERVIIELHAKMGNKWARMAAHLPGRTDNEIKNYWNTRVKRRQRSGVPLYPPGVFLQAYPEYQNQTTDMFSGGNKRHIDILQTNNYGLPCDLSTNSYGNLTTPKFNGHKRRYNSTFFNYGQDGKVCNGHYQFNRFHYDPCNENKSCDPGDPSTKYHQPFGAIQGIHSLNNGKFSAFKPSSEAVKSELPSLQYSETDLSSWGILPLVAPPLESADTDSSLRSPLTGTLKSEIYSPRNSGLLEALLDEAKALGSATKPSSNKSSGSSAVTPCEAEWEEYAESSSIRSPLTGTLKSEIYSPRNSGLLEALLDEANALGSAMKPSSNKSSGSSAVTLCDITETSILNLSEAEWEEYAESSSIQSQLMGTLKSEIYSPHNSGLLEALLDEANALGSATKPSSNKSSGSSAVTPCDITDTSKLNLSEAEWEEYAESFSTYDPSASIPSIFNDCTPITGGGSSLEKNSPANIPGKSIKSEPVDQAWAFDKEKEILTCSSRPDALLGLGWLEQCTTTKGNNVVSDPVSRLLGSDCGSDNKNIVSGIFSPSQDHERTLSSCTWDNMPTARQMFDFP